MNSEDFSAANGDTRATTPMFLGLRDRVESRAAVVAVIGLGYVGLPLARTIAQAGFRTLGIDIDDRKIRQLEEGTSYIRHIPGELIAELRKKNLLTVSSDFSRLRDADAILIAVPTPLTRQKTPDLSYVINTTVAIAGELREGQLIVLESTTYPGTTREVMKPILERTGLASGRDFFLGYSPEREDPGNPNFTTSTTPKIVGGDEPLALELTAALYRRIRRAGRSGIFCRRRRGREADREYLPFRQHCPGERAQSRLRGHGNRHLGSHRRRPRRNRSASCPFTPVPDWAGTAYRSIRSILTCKAREYDIPTRFIELAGEINTAMPRRVVSKLQQELNARSGRGLKGVRALVLGVAYKANVDNSRESPALKIIDELEAQGAAVDFYDPYLASIPVTREHPGLSGRRSIEWSAQNLSRYDCALIVTNHANVDYDELVSTIPLILDTRNATKDVIRFRERISKA